MNEDDIVSIEVDTSTKAVIIVYAPWATYLAHEVSAYVDDMTDNKSRSITIYEGDTLACTMIKVEGGWTIHDTGRV